MKKDSRFFFAILVFCFLYSNLIRISGVVVLPVLASQLGIGAATVGFLSSLFFYTYGGSFTPWGVAADRVGSFRTCGTAMLIAAFGAFVLMFASSVFWVGVGRVISGFGLSCSFTGVLLYSAQAFSREKYPTLVAISLMVGHSGTVLAVAPLGAALDLLGVRVVYFVLGAFAFILGALLLFFRNDDPHVSLMAQKTLAPMSVRGLWGDMKESATIVWRCFPLRVIALTWGICAASISTLQGLWAVTWLEVASTVSAADARMCATWISVGMCVGPFFGNYFTKRAEGRKKDFFLMCLFVELCWIAWMILTGISAGLFALSIVGFLIGTSGSLAMVFMGNAGRELATDGKVATILSILNTVIYLMVILFQWGTGLVIEFFDGKSLIGTSQLGYQIGFWLIVLLQGYFFCLILRTDSFKNECE